MSSRFPSVIIFSAIGRTALALRLGRLDAAVLEERSHEVGVHRLAMSRVSTELLAGAVMPHAAVLLFSEPEPVSCQRLGNLFDRLLAEVGNRGKLGL